MYPPPEEGEGREIVKTWEVRGLYKRYCLLRMAGSWLPSGIGQIFAFSFQDSLASAQLMSCSACSSVAYYWSRWIPWARAFLDLLPALAIVARGKPAVELAAPLLPQNTCHHDNCFILSATACHINVIAVLKGSSWFLPLSGFWSWVFGLTRQRK